MSPTDPTVSPSLPALDRRAFCAAAAAAAASLACGGGGGGAAAPPPPPPTVGPKTTTDTKAGLLATPDGTTRDYRNLGNFFLIKDAAGIYAMTTICTHMGCTVGLPVGGQITCPCHGSKYDLSGGNLLGPAVSPLVHLPVTEPSPGADLVVDTSQTVAATVRLT
jgi:Rieske Fe-S protein